MMKPAKLTSVFLFFSLLSNSQAFASSLRETMHSPSGQMELDLITKTRPTLNRVTLKHLGRESNPARYELAEKAQSYIFMSVPYWFGDKEGTRFRDFMAEQKKRKSLLDFRVVEDWTSPGSTGDFFAAKMYADLRGVTSEKIMQWNRPWSFRDHAFDLLRYRMHDKMFVVDGKSLIMGGMNVADEYLQGGLTRKGWHDTDILVEGPAAQDAAKIFIKVWELTKFFEGAGEFPIGRKLKSEALQSYFYADKPEYTWKAMDPHFREAGHNVPLITKTVHIPIEKYNTEKYFPKLAPVSGGVPVRLIYDNPLVDKTIPADPYYGQMYRVGQHHSKIMHTVKYLLEHAEESVRIFVPYLTPHEGFLQDLQNAARRGVKIQIITNSLLSHDLGKIPYKAGVAHYRDLLESGVEIFEWQGHKALMDLEKANGCEIPVGAWPGRTIHSKVAVFDNQVVLMGSHNFNQRSESMNSEIMALIEDSNLANQLTGVFGKDLDLNETRTIQCGDKVLARERQVEPITLDLLDTKLAKYERESKFWKFLQDYM